MTSSDRPERTQRHRRRAAVTGLLAAAVLTVLALVALRALSLLARAALRRPHAQIDDGVLVVALAVLALCLLWLALLTAVAAADLLGCRPPRRPAPARPAAGPGGALTARIAGLLLAVTAVSVHTATGAAQAAPTSISTSAPAVDRDDRRHAPPAAALPVPDFDRGPTRAPVDGTTRPPRPEAEVPEPDWTPQVGLRPAGTDRAGLLGAARSPGSAETVVVRRGDTLWSIVARRLGPEADAAAVAAAWPRWYQTNRTVIGEDPELLLPGTELRPPTPEVIR